MIKWQMTIHEAEAAEDDPIPPTPISARYSPVSPIQHETTQLDDSST